MKTPKQKLKNSPDSDFVEKAKRYGNRAMHVLFGVTHNWFEQRDILKNNYKLGLEHYHNGNISDAILRFSLVTWLDPKNADGWYYLGRSYLENGNERKAAKALAKAAALKPEYRPELALLAFEQVGTLAKLHEVSLSNHWNIDEFSKLLAAEGSFGFLAKTDQPLGFILCRSVHEQSEILTLAVLPDYRRHRIAAQLLEKAMAYAQQKGAAKMFLEVSVKNEAAIRLYEGAGFEEISRRAGYYKEADGSFTDALVMSRDL